ncbi:hypothetical protein D770_20325 [Flammeovirgaceae bacterium 311]|nr:hypothetical protein D770_20325 [Flammeovirgaceae bacterium 311]
MKLLLMLGFLMLLQADMPDFQMHSSTINVPVPAGSADYSTWYIIGAFGVAISALFSLALWLLRVIFREKEKALEREIERANRMREDQNSNDTSLKEVLQNINHTMGSLKDVINDLKKTDEKVLDELAVVKERISEGFIKIQR